ncbi:carboxynorspermidine decarboxylase [Membranihabitans maritimus]|uniref:carboxynorspermidine decarboxylase n=1 Tax=Membranihabitans maritimus TaxID=2904244 RepID=UPI001F0024FB|nr:carboxynorspermidine decarboxylase [Membranihabitans maritimus]
MIKQKYYYPNIPSPAYVLEEQKIRSNLEKLKYVREKAGIEIILALKAFSMWSVFPIVREYLDGATASSLFEAKTIFDEMGEKAHTYAPGYREDEIDELARMSQTIIFNSLDQYYRFGKKMKTVNSQLAFGIRVNPGYSEIETDLYNPASPGSRLGIRSLENVPDGINGLHFHALCENNSYTLSRVLDAFEERFGHLLDQLDWLNMGGGHLITSSGYEIEHLIQLLLSLKRRYSHLKIIMEPGSAIAWQTGFLKSTVMDVIDTPMRKCLILDISFTAHMPDCLEMPYNPEVRGAKYGTEGNHVYQLGGTSCLAGDQLGPYSFENEVKVGDEVIFEDMIHYTMVKTTMFNGVRHPDIGIINGRGEYRVQRSFTYEDFKSRLS